MSLFKARDWWSTTVGEEEEFDYGCMCTANVDNSNNEDGKIKYSKVPFLFESRLCPLSIGALKCIHKNCIEQ